MAPRNPTIAGRSRNIGAKRTRENDASAASRRGKRQRTAATTGALVLAHTAQPQQRLGTTLPTINHRPAQLLNIYVLGANSGGELGLGPSVKSGNVGKPRLNPYLSGSVGVIQVSLGAMHGVALTHDNRILTWGVNDHGALGRDTTWEGNFVDMDANNSDSDSDGDDEGELNPRESTPTEIDKSAIPPETVFTSVAATDNATFALTSTGRVYGWGAFRSEDGKLSFTPTVQVQSRPALVIGVSNVVKICGGSNHVMALTADGFVYTWGRGTDGQLGRRFSSRVVDWKKEGLGPRIVANLKNVVEIGSGSNHSFAVERTGLVYAWGFNNAGQIGVVDNAGEYESAYEFALTISTPTLVKSLVGFPRIIQITGGNFHSIAVTEDGKCLTWGRLYSYATGLKIDTLPSEHIVRDSRGKPSFLRVPTAVEGLSPAFVAAASEHSLATTTEETVYTWGLNLTKQIGHKEEEVEVATLLTRPDIADKRFVWVGAGAQFSMLGAVN
ncbi:hypothetical protein VTI74DRAFT_5894 [Chaetomium olivicolor]